VQDDDEKKFRKWMKIKKSVCNVTILLLCRRRERRVKIEVVKEKKNEISTIKSNFLIFAYTNFETINNNNNSSSSGCSEKIV
jgi:hypothetical protein